MKYALFVSFCLPALCAQALASDATGGDQLTFSTPPSPAPVVPVVSDQEREWAAARHAHCMASDTTAGPTAPAPASSSTPPSGQDLQEIGKELEHAGRDVGKAVEHAVQDAVEVAKTDPGVQQARQDLFQARDSVAGAFKGLFRR